MVFIIRSFCNDQSNHSILFYIFPTNKNKKWSVEFYFLQNQNKFVFCFLVKIWLKLSGWNAIDWLLQNFLQMKTLTTKYYVIFFHDFCWLIRWFPGKIRPWYSKFSSAVDSDFLDCLRHLLYSDTTIIFFIEEIKQNFSSKIDITTV